MSGKPFVVPDTNTFWGDPSLNKHKLRVLLGEHKRGLKRLAVPEAVIRELPKRFVEQMQSASTKVSKGAQDLRNLGIDLDPIEIPDAQQASHEYLARLRDRLLADGVLTLPITDRSVEEFFDAANARRRPFGAEGKGLKDAIIWRAVLDLAHDDEVILISKDGDFSGEQPNLLHDDLLEDLASEGLTPDRVRLARGIDEYLKRYVEPSTNALESARALLREEGPWASELRETLSQALAELDFSRDAVTIASSPNGSADFEYVEDAAVEAIEIADAYDTGDDSVVSLEVVVTAKMRFNVSASTHDMEWLVSERADVDFDLFEETFAQGHTGDRYVTVRFAVEFDIESNGVGEPEKLYAEDTATPNEPLHGA